MPKSNPELVSALRETANRIQSGARYEWGHMARCNCGHLVQTITEMSDTEIARSVDFELDEWSEYAKDYCAGTGQKVDDLFLALHNVGFGYDDVMHLENLSDRRVLNRLGENRYLRRNDAEDVVLYMKTMAELLETDEHSVNKHSKTEMVVA